MIPVICYTSRLKCLYTSLSYEKLCESLFKKYFFLYFIQFYIQRYFFLEKYPHLHRNSIRGFPWYSNQNDMKNLYRHKMNAADISKQPKRLVLYVSSINRALSFFFTIMLFFRGRRRPQLLSLSSVGAKLAGQTNSCTEVPCTTWTKICRDRTIL